jgi:exodeoxyribonuclease-5
VIPAPADRRLTRADLSPDQRSVYGSVLDWARRPHGTLTLGGYAGTGKSTLLGLFAAETKLKIAYVSFTGRASSVLARKLHAAGVQTTNRSQTDDERRLTGRWGHLYYSPLDTEATLPFCGTIHRLLYRAVINDKTEELMGWQKRETLDRKYDVIAIDESSMIDAEIVEDIARHGVPILAVGDHGQLPPVRGKGTLMVNPALRLEKIHRQAEGSPIIRLSRCIREEARLDRSIADGRQLVFGSTGDLRRRVLVDAGGGAPLDLAILCWKNQTREHINRMVREYKGYASLPPQAGETVLCLRNYPPVYNGMRGVLAKNAEYPYPEEWWILRAEIEFPEEGIGLDSYELCRDQFYRHETFKSVDELKAKGMKLYSMGEAGKLFDFGYAMTVHKSQGSQFPHAVVYIDWRMNFQDEGVRRLTYTAVTRASERLTVLT